MPKIKKSEFHKEIIEHIVSTWAGKMGFKYPFIGGKHGKLIKWLLSLYEPYEVKAMWDTYLNNDTKYFKQNGYKLEVFCSCITQLEGWRSLANNYLQKYKDDGVYLNI